MTVARSHRLVGPLIITNVAFNVFNVPAGEVWKVKWVDLLNSGTGLPTIDFAEDDATNGAKRIERFVFSANSGSIHSARDWVFEGGHGLSVVSTLVVGATVVLTVHGFKYSA